MSDNQFLVSIGMPVYQGDQYLAEALNSLLVQTYKNIQINISDNCSSDQTEQICRSFAKKDNRISYTRQTVNIGATANFNYVLQQAKGDFFMWAAHDDRWDAEYVEMLVKQLSNDASLSFLYGQSIFIDENDAICGRSINNFFSLQWLRNDRKNPDLINAIAYYLDRSPFKIYGMYRTNIIQKFKFEPFLGSARQADNVLLLKFLAEYEADECQEAIHYYRILPRPPEIYAETLDAVKHTHLKVEVEFFKIFVRVLLHRLNIWIVVLIPILPILFVGAILKPRAIIIKHWIFSTVPNWIKSCLTSKKI